MNRKTRGGQAGSMPLRYVDPQGAMYGASEGRDLLHASGRGVRPMIGGKRKSVRRTKGGFVPSIMEGFCEAASRYIAPLALLAMHRFVGHKKTYKRKMKSKR